MKIRPLANVALDLLILAAAVAGVFFPYVFTSAVFPAGLLMTDIVLQEMGVSRFSAHEIASGRLPLWNPYVFMGIPHLAMGYSSVLYPSTVAYAFGPFPTIYKFDFLIHCWIGGVCMYGLGRALFVTRTAAVCCGLYFMWVTPFTSFVFAGHLSTIHTYAYIPLVLLCVLKVLSGGRAVWGLAFGLALCLQIFAGYFQLVAYELFVLGVLCVAELGRQLIVVPDSRRQVLLRGVILLSGLALGLVCASVLLFPAYELWKFESVRGERVSRAFASLGDLVYSEMIGNFNWIDITRGGFRYPTGFLLAFAVLGLFQRKTKLGFALCMVAAVAMLVAFGTTTPFYDVFRRLPVLGSTRGLSRIIVFATAALICLAGFGIDAMLESAKGKRSPFTRIWPFCLAAAALFAAPILSGVDLKDPYFVLYALILGIIFVFAFDPRVPSAILVLAILASVGFDASRYLSRTFPAPGVASDYNVSDDWETIAEQHTGHDRFTVLATARQVFRSLNPQIGSMYEERTLNGYGALPLRRYVNFFERSLGVPLNVRTPEGEYAGTTDVPEGWLSRQSQVEALGMLNVKYFVAPRPGSPILNVLVSQSEAIKRFDVGNLVLYSNNAASSPAYVLHQAVVDAEHAGIFDRSMKSLRIASRVYGEQTVPVVELDDRVPETSYAFDVAVLDEEIPLELGPPARTERAEIVAYLPSRVEIRAEVSAPGILVLTDMYYPGWKCRVDGKREEKVFPVDGVLRGVQVLPGDTSVVFSYEPESFRYGLMTTVAGAGLAIGWLILAFGRGRRRRLAVEGPAGGDGTE